MNQDQQRVARIDVIDGLRGIAILSVLYIHLSSFYRFWNPGWHGTWIFGLCLSPYTISADLIQGVPLFFILSGLVLYLPYVLGYRTMKTKSDTLRFYKRRARRLLPLFYINVFFILAFVAPPQPPLATFKQLFFLGTFLFTFFTPNFQETSLLLPNFPLWSLGVEIWFCVLMPLIIWAMDKYGHRTILLAFIVLSMATRLGYSLTTEITGMSALSFQLMNTVPERLVDFVVGMTIAHEFVAHQAVPKKNYWIAVGAFFLIFSTACWEVVRQEQVPFVLTVSNDLLVIIGLGLMVYGLLLTKSTILKAIFANWPIRLIGMMSYSIFIWHAPALFVLRPDLNFIRFLRYIFLIFATSFLSYRYIEFGSVTDWKLLLPRWHGKPTTEKHLAIVSQ
jgi:peptidoglycan/LPS O-acetylase OafA/YrhL